MWMKGCPAWHVLQGLAPCKYGYVSQAKLALRIATSPLSMVGNHFNSRNRRRLDARWGLLPSDTAGHDTCPARGLFVIGKDKTLRLSDLPSYPDSCWKPPCSEFSHFGFWGLHGTSRLKAAWRLFWNSTSKKRLASQPQCQILRSPHNRTLPSHSTRNWSRRCSLAQEHLYISIFCDFFRIQFLDFWNSQFQSDHQGMQYPMTTGLNFAEILRRPPTSAKSHFLSASMLALSVAVWQIWWQCDWFEWLKCNWSTKECWTPWSSPRLSLKGFTLFIVEDSVNQVWNIRHSPTTRFHFDFSAVNFCFESRQASEGLQTCDSSKLATAPAAPFGPKGRCSSRYKKLQQLQQTCFW